MKAREMTWKNGPGVDGINTSAVLTTVEDPASRDG
jgi:hypothetical protein